MRGLLRFGTGGLPLVYRLDGVVRSRRSSAAIPNAPTVTHVRPAFSMSFQLGLPNNAGVVGAPYSRLIETLVGYGARQW